MVSDILYASVVHDLPAFDDLEQYRVYPVRAVVQQRRYGYTVRSYP